MHAVNRYVGEHVGVLSFRHIGTIMGDLLQCYVIFGIIEHPLQLGVNDNAARAIGQIAHSLWFW